MNRTKKTTLSVLTGFLSYFGVAIMSFISRGIFIKHLSVELLGVNGLFSNILLIFSLAELGFGTAVGVALYKPLQENDEQKISALMNFYSKIYRLIGCVILLIGFIVVFFLQYLINDFEKVTIPLNDLRLYFLLILLSSVSTYFFAYKKTILASDQKKYILNLTSFVFLSLTRIVQIIILILFQNFILYLVTSIVLSFAENIVASIIVNKQYKYLGEYKKVKITDEERKKLFSNIGALSISKFSGVMVTGIVYLIISRMIGLEYVGKYSNYAMVLSTLTSIMTVFISAITASVGNFSVTESKERQLELFSRLNYVFAFISSVCFVGLFTQLDSFINLWLKPEMLLEKSLAKLLACYILIYGMRIPSWIMYNAYGLYKHYYYKSFFEVAVFFALAIPGSMFLSGSGIILAQIIAILVTQIWVEFFTISKYALDVSIAYFVKLVVRHLIIAAIALGLTMFACSVIPLAGTIGLIVKSLFAVLIVTLVFILLTFRSKEFKYFFNLLIRNRKLFSKTNN